MLTPSLIPSPWRTLARTLLRVLYAAILLILLWSLWYAYAAHRLNAQLARYRAQNQPASPQDLVDPPVPASENAYDLLAAADSLSLTPAEKDLVEASLRTRDPSLPLSSADLATAKTMLDTHAADIDLLHQAIAATKIAWPDELQLYFGTPPGPFKLAAFRHLLRFRRIAALYYHQIHRDDLSFDAFRDMQSIAAITDHGRFLIDHLVTIACYATTAQNLIHIAPELELQSPSTPHGVPRNVIQALITSLLDQQPLHHSLINTLYAERTYELALAEKWDHRNILLRPMFNLDVRRVFDQMDGLTAAIGPSTSNFPAIRTRLPAPLVYTDTNLQHAAHLISYTYTSGYEKAVEFHYRGLTDRTAAALRLAIRLYQLEHQNQIPPDLASLVPAYLPLLPPDPFRSDGGPLTYVPARRLFYSFGDNGIDDAGTTLPIAFVVNWHSPDAVYPLDRPAP